MKSFEMSQYLSTVDFEVTAWDGQLEIFVFWCVQKLENVFGGQGVDAVLRVLKIIEIESYY